MGGWMEGWVGGWMGGGSGKAGGWESGSTPTPRHWFPPLCIQSNLMPHQGRLSVSLLGFLTHVRKSVTSICKTVPITYRISFKLYHFRTGKRKKR